MPSMSFIHTLKLTSVTTIDDSSQVSHLHFRIFQVCNLSWSKNVNEIVSTHGYSLNQIIVWKYPSMQKVI